jgi:hypothetical protein
LICPDIRQATELVLKGDSASMIKHSYQFTINRCVGKSTCHKKETVDAWLTDVDVEMWAMQKVVDFKKYGLDPTYWTNLMYTASLLDVKLITKNYIYIATHVYDNVDSWLPFTQDITGQYSSIGR